MYAVAPSSIPIGDRNRPCCTVKRKECVRYLELALRNLQEKAAIVLEHLR